MKKIIGKYVYIFHCFRPKGKSLSLICGALKWLVDSEKRDKAKIAAVLAGELPASALVEPTHVVVATSNHEDTTTCTPDVKDGSSSAKPG